MKQSIASAADPDGQPLMDTLLDLEVPPSKAYNTVQGTHNMAGKNVIAAMEARFVETNAKFVETNARITETNAKVSETNAKVSETQAMIASIGAELRTLKWICGLSLALSGMLVTVVMALVLYLLPGDRAPSKSAVATVVAEESEPAPAVDDALETVGQVATAVAEESEPAARPAGTDPEETGAEGPEQDARQ